MKRFKWVLAIMLILSLSSCDLILGLLKENGTIAGTVRSSATGLGLAGVVVSATGASGTATTGSDGGFTLPNVPEGTVTVHFSKSGYMFTDVSGVVVVADETTYLSEDAIGYPPLASGDYRFVLTWGAEPRDLDSHLFVPIGASWDEVYFGHKNATDGSANLDWDDTTGYGPETVTITSQNSGTYYYSVYLWGGDGTIKNSPAVVKVYNSAGLVQTYYASAGSGDSTKDWWRVCTLNGGALTTLNTFADSGK